MIITYLKDSNILVRNNELLLDDHTAWIDLVSMTAQEEHIIESKLGIDIPSREEMAQVEISNRLYVENEAVYITLVLTNIDNSRASNHLVTFILYQNILITVRYFEHLKPLDCFPSILKKNNYHYLDQALTLIEMIHVIIRDFSEKIDKLGQSIDKINETIFMKETDIKDRVNYSSILREIGRQANIISKSQESLLSITVGINFLLKNIRFSGDEAKIFRLNTMLNDVNALSNYTHSLDSEIAFLLSASLGMISIEQNNIAKLVSTISVLFLPPTLIASIYGMNFDFMPELKYRLGYPFSLGIILASAFISYIICKRKKWL